MPKVKKFPEIPNSTFGYSNRTKLRSIRPKTGIRTDIGDFKKIKHADFEKLQLRVGTIAQVKIHPKNPKVYIILLDCAAADEDIQVVASLVESYKMAELLGKQAVILCNIEPELVNGEESQGMILTARLGKKLVLVGPHKQTAPGGEVLGIMNGTCHHFGEH